jgi:hypothetical protein
MQLHSIAGVRGCVDRRPGEGLTCSTAGDLRSADRAVVRAPVIGGKRPPLPCGRAAGRFPVDPRSKEEPCRFPGALPPSKEVQASHASRLERDHPSSAWTGWVTSAASLLVVLGLLNIFQGLLALLHEGYFIVPGDDLVLVSYDAWGVLLGLWGCLLLLTGMALASGRGWARWRPGVAVTVNIVAQIGVLPSRPILAATLIALDVVVLYALTVRWREAQRGY